MANDTERLRQALLALEAAIATRNTAEAEVTRAVLDARQAGASWRMIAEIFGQVVSWVYARYHPLEESKRPR